jgi:hypothetical protein
VKGFILVGVLKKYSVKQNIKDVWPAFAILLAILFISLFITEFTFVSGTKSLWRVFVRFIRISVILTLPLLLLSHTCTIMRNLLNRRNRQLVQIQEERNRAINHLSGWLLRPLQGIGLSMLISTKFLDFLQIYMGSTVNASIIVPTGQFNFGRFLSATVVLVLTSLLLSFLWTLDDLGIRYYNKKTGEVKMIGKYLGLLLPIFFGFYGIINLLENYVQSSAVWYVTQMAIILYPPFVVYNVSHFHYTRKNESLLLQRLKVSKQAVLINDG